MSEIEEMCSKAFGKERFASLRPINLILAPTPTTRAANSGFLPGQIAYCTRHRMTRFERDCGSAIMTRRARSTAPTTSELVMCIHKRLLYCIVLLRCPHRQLLCAGQFLRYSKCGCSKQKMAMVARLVQHHSAQVHPYAVYSDEYSV